jgi:hypothetical protein
MPRLKVCPQPGFQRVIEVHQELPGSRPPGLGEREAFKDLEFPIAVSRPTRKTWALRSPLPPDARMLVDDEAGRDSRRRVSRRLVFTRLVHVISKCRKQPEGSLGQDSDDAGSHDTS